MLLTFDFTFLKVFSNDSSHGMGSRGFGVLHDALRFEISIILSLCDLPVLPLSMSCPRNFISIYIDIYIYIYQVHVRLLPLPPG